MRGLIRNFLIAVLVALVGEVAGANAAVIKYDVNGIFVGGGTLSGSFTIDNTGYPNIVNTSLKGILLGNIYNEELIITDGATYVNAPLTLNFFNGSSHLVLTFVSADYSNSYITNIANGNVIGGESLHSSGASLQSGTITAENIPEPLSLAMLGTSVAVLAVYRRKRSKA